MWSKNRDKIQVYTKRTPGKNDPVSMKESVYIIIPVHNRKQITINCLENLNTCGDLQKYHVIVVDDGSTDGTTEVIRELYPMVKILIGDGNLWWTGAIAMGMRYAYEQGATHFIWLNDDCILAPNALSLLVEFLHTHPNAIVSAACYASESGLLVETGFKGRQRFRAKEGEVILVDGLSGYCVGIPVSVFHKIATPDSSQFRHYDGDGMYTLKATRSGFKAYILGSAKVTLLNERDPIHKFQSYLYSIPEPTLKSLFWNFKSPYHLPTQFFYHAEKYGIFLGIPLFFAKTISWLQQWITMQVKVKMLIKKKN